MKKDKNRMAAHHIEELAKLMEQELRFLAQTRGIPMNIALEFDKK